MKLSDKDFRALIKKSNAAIDDAIRHSHLAKAWDLLQERGENGTAAGPLPYTDAALKELALAHQQDPDNIGIIHHLAISHHARAWDLELAGSPGAAAEWECALGHWRALSASGPFWEGLGRKLLACDPKSDPAILSTMRRDLLENLLDIHVDFVRHYCDGQAPERATAHVEIVQRAKLPPAVKKRLTGKVFDAMTGAVPETKAKREYESALTMIERFLKIFPDYLSALRMHAEVCHEWVSGLSFQDDWAQIVEVSARSEPYFDRLASHPDLDSDPLAGTELDELALAFAMAGYNRGAIYYIAKDQGQPSAVSRPEARQCLEFGKNWSCKRLRSCAAGSEIRQVYAECAKGSAFLYQDDMKETAESSVSDLVKIRTIRGLCQQVIQELTTAASNVPEDDTLNQNLAAVRQNLADIRAQEAMLELQERFGGRL